MYTKNLKLVGWVSAATLLVISNAWAVQPMNESDLEDVSALVGVNILNIMGAPGAGLSDDDEELELDISSHEESSEAEPVANQSVRELEENAQTQTNEPSLALVSDEQSQTIVKNTQTKTYVSDILPTTSEMQFKQGALKHDMKLIENGGVEISRDLSVDLLKLENLKGDSTDQGATAGSIYLSNWRSFGETRIVRE